MNTTEPFSGFPAEGLQFLTELAYNNNREWFQGHKETYRNKLMAPAQAYVAALGERLQSISAGITYDTRLSGGSLMRIHRDVRFSKDKTPYKTHLGIVLWEGRGKRNENPGFYIHLEPSKVQIMTGQHMFPKPMLAAYRDAVADDDLGGELESVLAQVREAGALGIGGEHYKRVPRGYDPEHPRADLLRHNGLHAELPPIGREHLTSPELVDLSFEWCNKMAPLHHWLVEVSQAAQ